jgi:hypothetical protein
MLMRALARSALVLGLALIPAAAGAQEAPYVATVAPGIAYDPAIPTLEAVVGHDHHEDITHPDQIAAYFQALAAAAPGRAHLIEYARTWEGRPLHMLVIGSPERIARLEALKSELRRLAFPEGLSDAEAEDLIASMPVVVALLHSIHGNEVSGAGAALVQAYHLLAARNDPRVDAIRRDALVLIDPIQNPDGRARFVAHYRQTRAFPPDAHPTAAEHDEPWPGGRTNHYLFDLNRDWFPLSQPESQGKIRTLLDFSAHVVADLHEMGGNSTYYFPPAAPPGNPWTSRAQLSTFEVLGRAMAAAFDERGWGYFTREVFDAYYPGYGASWPTAQGALGMTFEQASPRGLVFRRSDGDLLTYGDGIAHHFIAGLTSAATAAANRERILRDFLAFRRQGMRMAQEGGPAEIVLHSAHDPALAHRLAVLLARNGIQVRQPQGSVSVDGRRLAAAGTFIVPVGQPAAALARNLLDPTTDMDAAFEQRQIERRAQRLPDQIYDITAWSLPLLWDVEAIPTDRATGAGGAPVTPDPVPMESTPLPPALVGYLLSWNSATAAVVAEALREGLRVRTLRASTTIGGRVFGAGAAFLRTAENPDDMPERLAGILALHGGQAVALDSSFKDDGISLGSNQVGALVEPRILLAYGAPASSYSAGWARFVMERRYGLRVTAVRADNLGRLDLSDFHVVVLPSGSYGLVLDNGGIDRLQDWMRAGGTLVTMAESARWAGRAGLLGTGTELRGGAPEQGNEQPRPQTPDQPIDLLEAITPSAEPPEQTPGAILNVVLDTTHWLAAGTDGKVGAMVSSSRIFTPLTLDEGTNVGVYGALDDLVAGGIVWEEARPQLASKAFLMHQRLGRGQLVAFAEDPNYRAYAEATQLLFINAVLLGPSR